MKNDVVEIRCQTSDIETTESLQELFPEALCMQINSGTGVEVMNFVVTVAALYSVMNVSSTIKDFLDHDKVEMKIGDFEVKGGYKHAVELTEKYMQKQSEESKETKSAEEAKGSDESK